MGKLIKQMKLFLFWSHRIFFCVIFKTQKSEICRETPELWSVTYTHTDRQSDMAFFLRMRLLASPFGLAISIKDRKASLSARREGIVVSQLKTVLNDKFRAYR
jgi:hypothetical protein